MTTTVTVPVSTREKLVRAKEASARVQQLSTDQKNAILLAMADAIEKHATSILQANSIDLETSGLTGAMRDRLLLTPERIAEMAEHLVRRQRAPFARTRRLELAEPKHELIDVLGGIQGSMWTHL